MHTHACMCIYVHTHMQQAIEAADGSTLASADADASKQTAGANHSHPAVHSRPCSESKQGLLHLSSSHLVEQWDDTGGVNDDTAGGECRVG